MSHYLKSPAPTAVIELASGKRNVWTPVGGRRATGKITFANNPTANDTVTFNGVEITFVASGATGNQVNIGGDLDTTLDSLASFLNTSTDALLTVATYTKTGSNDEMTVTYDTYVTEGNEYTLAASSDTPSGATLTGGQTEDGMDVNAYSTFELVTTDGTAMDFTLPDGEEGQEIFLYFKTKGSGANAKVNGNFVSTNVSLTFDTAGEFTVLKCLAGEWVAVVNSGGSLA